MGISLLMSTTFFRNTVTLDVAPADANFVAKISLIVDVEDAIPLPTYNHTMLISCNLSLFSVYSLDIVFYTKVTNVFIFKPVEFTSHEMCFSKKKFFLVPRLKNRRMCLRQFWVQLLFTSISSSP
jgi:hypothetical protein